MKIIAFLIGTLCLISSARAQSDWTIKFPDGASRSIWVGQSPTEKPPEVIQKSTQPEAILKNPKGAYVLVRDDKTGNLAARKLADIKAGKDAFTDADFNLIGVVYVEVTYEGKPVAAAAVTLIDSLKLMDATSDGVVTFYGLKPAMANVKVDYRSGGKSESLSQQFVLAIDRPVVEPLLKIAIPDETATVDSSAQSSDATKGADPKPDPGKTPAKQPDDPMAGVRGFLVYLIFLAAAIAAGYFILKYLRDNPGVVGPKLEKLGVQIPKPADAPMADADPVAAPPVTPMPVQKIVLDPSAPDSSPMAANPAAMLSPSTGNPRLIAENGDVMAIAEGRLVVGRDVGLGLSLLNESTVSRRHAVVVRSGDKVVVQDAGSTNGSFVNGVKVAGQSPLNHGDLVQFGSVRFRYEA